MKIKITDVSEFVVLAETEHEQQWLAALTNGYGRKQASVEYLYPNHEPKDFNNPVVSIKLGMTKGSE